MQIQNFYSDWLPTTIGQLDSIVLSPHTMKTNDYNLTNMKVEYCELQEILASQDFDNLTRIPVRIANNQDTCSLKKCCNWLRNRRAKKNC